MDAIRSQLAADHRVLEHLFRHLLHDLVVHNEGDLRATWCELEHRLLSHIDVEEQLLLPVFGVGHHAAAERTRAEHAQIRTLLDDLGAAVELHSLHESAVLRLLQVLDAHIEREDRLIYRFACEVAPDAVQCRLAAALRAAARTAHEAASKALANR
jgi:hypothetical protein